jgi:hypothetical protein
MKREGVSCCGCIASVVGVMIFLGVIGWLCGDYDEKHPLYRIDSAKETIYTRDKDKMVLYKTLNQTTGLIFVFRFDHKTRKWIEETTRE